MDYAHCCNSLPGSGGNVVYLWIGHVGKRVKRNNTMDAQVKRDLIIFCVLMGIIAVLLLVFGLVGFFGRETKPRVTN